MRRRVPARVLKEVLGERYRGTLQTDGYHVYAKYAASLPGCVHALLGAHAAGVPEGRERGPEAGDAGTRDDPRRSKTAPSD